MNEFRIKFSYASKQDMKEIIRYIKNNLKEPQIAKKYEIYFKNEIGKLTNFPKKFVEIDEEKIQYKGIRKLIVKNYIVFYRVNEEKNLISIERVLYGASDWKNKL